MRISLSIVSWNFYFKWYRAMKRSFYLLLWFPLRWGEWAPATRYGQRMESVSDEATCLVFFVLPAARGHRSKRGQKARDAKEKEMVLRKKRMTFWCPFYTFLFFFVEKKMYIAAGSAYKYAWCKGRERASRWPGDVSLSLSLSLFLLLLQWKLTYQRPFYAKKEFLYWCKDTQVCNARTRSIEIAKNCLKKRQCEGSVAVRCKVN